MYLNPHCDVLRRERVDFARCSLDDFSSFFSRSIPKRFDDRHYQHTQLYPSHQQHHFLLKPIDAHARLVVNRDPFDTSGPKFDLAVSIPEVALRLEDSQYCDLLYLASAFQVPSHVAKYQQYKRLRPRASVLDAAPGEWWQYAITAVLQDVRLKKQRWSWAYMKDRREDRQRYVAAWEKRSRRLLAGHEQSDLDSESDDDDLHDRDVLSESNDDADDDDHASMFSAGSHGSSSHGSSRGTAAVLDEIESRRSVEDILFFRYLADRRVRESPGSATSAAYSMPMPASATFSDSESVDTELSESTMPTEAKFRSWGTWMFGWTSKLTASSSNGQPDDAPKRVLPEIELRELFKILEYEPSKRSKQARKQQKTKKRATSDADNDDQDFVHDLDDHEASDEFRVTVTLGKGSLTLASDAETNKKLQRDDPSFSAKYAPTDFLLGTFSHLQLAAVGRTDAIKVDVSLQSIEAFDESSESSSFSRLLSRKQGSVIGASAELETNAAFSGPVFLMSYETNPEHSSVDAALYIHLEPLEVVFSPTATCWGRLSRFLNTPNVLGLWAELEVASFNDIVNLKARTEAKLKYAMANRIAVAVDLRIQAPVLIIPESDTDINCARLVVDLGHINFRTDRLSKLDGQAMSSSSSAPLSGLGSASSFALMNPLSSPSLTSSTSFVKQLYDEAEKGEGAIRWKEEFYDKFSLAVTNVHAFLVPYGKNRQASAAASSASASRLRANALHDEHEYELVERFTINVTVRMSVLPLDATLTRFYVHADLPALTFKMSLEKYFQLSYLVERFSVASASSTDASPFESSLFDTTDLFDGLDANPYDQDDRFAVARRKNSFLSASALHRIMNDDEVGESSKSAIAAIGADAIHLDSGDSDGESSTGSDDTWFSIASGTVDLNLLSPLDSAPPSTGVEAFPAERLARPDATAPSLPDASQPRRKAKKADRPYAATVPPSELLDRRLMVCTFTFPLISVQLKKPSSMGVPASASYRYDGSDFEEDFADNGTILVKLQGFRVRLAKKTLSTQANCSFRSLEVEDYLDASGKASEFLLFSCPTITAPFSMRAPQRRTGKAPYAPNVMPRRRASRQRERVISFQRQDAAPSAVAPAAPENLLEFVFSSVNDSVTGDEVLREMDVRVGCLQFNFDQSYICSLLELLDETTSKLALAPAPATDFAMTLTADGEGVLPPLQLTPSVSQEYSLPMSLTESVRADLENARKKLLETQASAAKTAASSRSDERKPALLKVTLRTQSLSVCFGDRGEPEASVAILRVQAQLNTVDGGDVIVKGTVGDVKVFDLCPKKQASEAESDGPLGGGGATGANKRESSRRTFTDIFGLDISALTARTGGAALPQFIVGVDCRIARPTGDATASAKSSVSIAIQPIQLLVQPDFVESLTSYVMDGPLRLYMLTRHDQQLVHKSRVESTMRHPRSQSFGFDDAFVRHPRSQSFGFDDAYARHPRSLSFVLENSSLLGTQSPFLDAVSFASPRNGRLATPFFDAVDPSSKRTSPKTPMAAAHRDDTMATTVDTSPTDTTTPATRQPSVLDSFDIELKLVSTSIVLPSMAMDGASHSGGLCIHFGSVIGSVANLTAQDTSDGGDDETTALLRPSKAIDVDISGLEIKFLHDDVRLLEKTGLRMHCHVPAQQQVATLADASDDCSSSSDRTQRMDVTVDVSAVCVNVGEKTACLGLDVFYGTIKPIMDIASMASQRRDRDDADSFLGSVMTKDDTFTDDVAHGEAELAQSGSHFGALGLSASVSIQEIKVALQAHSEAPQVFESWLRSVFDASDDGHARDVASMLAQNGLGSPRRQRHDTWGRKPSLPRSGPSSTLVAEVVATGLLATLAADSLDALASSAQCAFSMQRAVIRDKIADPDECITDLLEPVRRTSAPQSAQDERVTRRSLSAASRHSSTLDLSLDDRASVLSAAVDDELEAPQLSISVRAQPPTQDGAQTSDLSMVVTLTSARVNVLPRTLLRLEHFGVETFLAVRKRMYQLEAQYKPRLLVPSSTARNHAYMDGMRDFGGESRSDDHATMAQRSDRWMETSRFGLASARKNSMSDSVRDGESKKLTFLSPVPPSLSIDGSDRHGKLTTSDLATSVHATAVEETADEEDGDDDKAPAVNDEREAVDVGHVAVVDSSSSSSRSDRTASDVAAPACAWVVRVELSNLQLWLLSTDKKAEAAGVKLCASVAADVATFRHDSDAAVRAHSDLVVGSVELRGVELSICSPIDERTETDARSGGKSVHFPWTIVEAFSVHAALRSFVVKRPQLKNEAASASSSAVKIVSFDAAALSFDDANDELVVDASLLERVPSEWSDWVQHEPSVRVDAIASRISYRNLPVLLKIATSLSSVASAEEKERQTLTARLKAMEDEFGWESFSDADDRHAGASGVYPSLSEREGDGSVFSDDLVTARALAVERAVTQATLEMDGIQFRVINNIVDQESPVIGLNIGRVSATHVAVSSTGELELSVATAIDAWYHNLRLVTSEPLIEPWKVDLVVSRQPSALGSGRSNSDAVVVVEPGTGRAAPPLEVKVLSTETLQVNLTEAFIANLMAANRAWKWVVNEGGDPREMTEYSTYWIRNNTGLNLHYWGSACKASTLVPGGEEPLEFVDNDASDGDDAQRFFHDQTVRAGASGSSERKYQARSRQIFVAVFEDPSDSDDGELEASATSERKWQSETAIPVDQVDSRMYALVNPDTDGFSTKLRKCECVIDVLVERGCKVFVVRSTLLLENNTGSDLEVEFLPPPAQYVSPETRADVSPIWRSVVKAASVVPVPLHLVSLGDGHIATRPPEIKSFDSHGKALAKPYAKERVRLPLLDRDTTAASSDDASDATSTMKFHRLFGDRPVRPFIMRACLNNSSSGLYHRTLSFHPPLVIHNLTAGPLEFCLSTPNDWVPAAEGPSTSVRAFRKRWEDAQQRLRERGTIQVADSVIWHLSDWDTPLELSVRMKGFEWSEPIVLGRDVVELERIKMKDVVTDSFLYITAESAVGSASKCREMFLYVPYWIVNLTGLTLEYEFDDERTGSEHLTTYVHLRCLS